MTKHLLFAAAIAFAAGCTDGKETGDSGGDTTGGGGGGTTFSVSVVSSGVDFSTSSSDSFSLGLAETTCDDPAYCWYGEDCIYGHTSGNFNFCHGGMVDGDSLSKASSVDDIVEGSTTLFHSGLGSGVTVYIESASGADCFISGDDPSYYSGLGCTSF